MHPEPKTITFNARPEDEAQFRSARAGGRVAWWLIGVPSLVCLAIAAIYNLVWAASVGTSIVETIMLCTISIALSAFVGGMPTAKVLLAASYPGAAQQADTIWFGALWLSGFSIFYFVLTRDYGSASQVSWVAAGYLDERQTRALASLILALAALTGGSLGLRLAVLASAESWRLGTGQAQWGAAVPAATQQAVPTPLPVMAGQSPEDIFSLWVNSRVKIVRDPVRGNRVVHVQGSDGFRDYQEACRIAEVSPLSMTKFGTLMTAWAAASNGKVTKGKIDGNIAYKGCCLVGSADDVPESGEASLPIETPKGAPPAIPLYRVS